MADYRTPLPAMLAATLQSGLNTVLSLDPASFQRLERLRGRTLKLVLEGIGIELFFTTTEYGIEVGLEAPANDAGEAAEPATTVSGTPAALFSMAASELGEGWSAPGSSVNIYGDATLARDFERLFSRLDPDIEGAFSGLFGDVLGHQIAVGLKQGSRQARDTAKVARDVLGEILRDGPRGNRSGPAVGRGEARDFAEGVDDLRDAVERLEARIRLFAQADEKGGDAPV